MIPTRQKLIGGDKVEEYRLPSWTGDKWLAVYINGEAVEETYDQAVARLEREALDKRRQV